MFTLGHENMDINARTAIAHLKFYERALLYLRAGKVVGELGNTCALQG